MRWCMNCIEWNADYFFFEQQLELLGKKTAVSVIVQQVKLYVILVDVHEHTWPLSSISSSVIPTIVDIIWFDVQGSVDMLSFV